MKLKFSELCLRKSYRSELQIIIISVLIQFFCNPRIFAEEAKKLMENRKEEDSDVHTPLGVGPVTSETQSLTSMQRQASANNLGDRQGDGTTFTFAIDDDQKSKNPLVRQYTSAELIDALKGADSAALDDQDKISSFISQLKKGDIATNKKTSEFRKKRLTYEHIPSNAPSQDSPDKVVQQPNQVISKEKSKPKRTTIFASSEIGVRQDKKPPFVPSLMGTFSCHGKQVVLMCVWIQGVCIDSVTTLTQSLFGST